MRCEGCHFDQDNPPPRETWEREKRFIEIEGHFTVSIYSGPYENDTRSLVSVYACPLCGTLKIDPRIIL